MYPIIVWNLTLIAFIFISRKTFFSVRREAGNYSTTLDSSTSIAVIAIALGIIFLNSHLKSMRKVIAYMPYIFVFYMFSWLSLLWAGWGYAFTISFKSLENIVNVFVIGIIVLNVKDTKKLMYYMILFATASTYASIFSYYIKYGFKWYHTNAYTITAFTGWLLSLGCIKFRIFTFRELAIPLVMCLYAWVSGTSTASYIAGLCGLVVLLSSRKQGVNATATIFVCLFVCAVWLLAGDIVFKFIAANHTEEALRTGTGRDVLWEGAIKSWNENPWLGKGYIVGESRLGNSKQISAHNSFLSALVNTGIIGILLFVLFVVKWMLQSFLNSKHNIYATITFPVIIAIVVNLNSCPVLGSHWSFVTDTMLLVVAATSMSFIDTDYGDRRTLRELMNVKKE